MREKRHNYTPEEKVSILRRHLVEHVAVSDLCDEYQSAAPRSDGHGSASNTRPRVNPTAAAPLSQQGNIRQIIVLSEKHLLPAITALRDMMGAAPGATTRAIRAMPDPNQKKGNTKEKNILSPEFPVSQSKMLLPLFGR